MKAYLENLLPRIKQYSQDLDRKELFVDVPWVVIDADANQHKYIFKRDGQLVMSRNGQVTIGTWEYLSAAKSLLVNRVQDTILLNQNFLDPAVMILRVDGQKNENIIMANEVQLPNLDVLNYLKRRYLQSNAFPRINQETGGIIQVIQKGSISQTEFDRDNRRRSIIALILVVLMLALYKAMSGSTL